MADKEFFAFSDIDCEGCGSIIEKDEQFWWFNGNKIYHECWDALMERFNELGG